MVEDKLDKILRVLDDTRENKGWTRVLNWMEKHPILSVIVLYVFISKIAKAVENHHE